MMHVAVVTGTRAEFGILWPVIDKIDFHPNLKASIVVTGMHLSPECGMTVRDVELGGIPIAARVDMLLSSDSMPAMGKSLGIGVTGLTQELERLRPDLVMVLGDRIEAFAGAIAGLFCGAAVAHIHGGEITRGGVDEYMRHAITKLSHVHFAATAPARQRIINMGEHPRFVFHTGSPGLDEMVRIKPLSRDELAQELGYSLPDRYALTVQHPISTHPETSAFEITETLDALKGCGIFAIVGYPNADAGNRAIRDAIDRCASEGWLKSFVNLPRRVYASLLAHSAVMVGNSSSGLIDSPVFGVPVVNIGERQEGRERGENVIDVPCEREAIAQAIQKALTDEPFIQTAKHAVNPYGDGYASDKIVTVLESLDLALARKNKRLPW